MFLRTLVTTLLLASFAVAQNPVPPPNEDPFVGVWIKNMKESPPIKWGNYTLAESYVSQTVIREGDEMVVAEHDGPSHWCCSRGSSQADSEPKDSAFRQTCDGKLHSLPSYVLTCQYVAPNVTEGKTVYHTSDVVLHKTKVVYWRTEISADGKKMTDSQYKDPERTNLIARSVFDRVR